jgi:hypothetical protein
VTNFVKSVNQTNIILISIPYRHDSRNFHTNKKIKIFNRILCKLAKIFSHVNVIEVDNNRQLFTAHGSHLNRLGKALLSGYLLLHIYSLDKLPSPLGLDNEIWTSGMVKGNINVGNPSILMTRTSSRIKTLLQKRDLLW